MFSTLRWIKVMAARLASKTAQGSDQLQTSSIRSPAFSRNDSADLMRGRATVLTSSEPFRAAVPSALREPGNCRARLRASVQCALEATGLKMDAVLQTERTIYSLRHTAICMRIILSHGQVNIFNLAKNAGTSVEQIERFYARNLPLSPELAKNLQSFGEG